MHTHDILTIAAAIVPDRSAITFDGQVTTFEGLSARANKLANAVPQDPAPRTAMLLCVPVMPREKKGDRKKGTHLFF